MRGQARAAALFAALLLPALVAAAGRRSVTAPDDTAKPLPGSLNIVFSTELNGNITPCGCAKPMLGGLPRRASYLKTLGGQASTLTLDNGDLAEALGRQDELKAETIVEAFDKMQYAAINLGEKDFRLGLPYLQSLQPRFKGAFLCANARKPDGTPHFQEFTTASREAGNRKVKVAIAGVISERFKEMITPLNPDVRIEDPAAVLERLQPALLSAGEVRILLFHGPQAEAEALGSRFPFFQLIVCGHEGDHPTDQKRINQTVVACSGQDGKYIGRESIAPAGGWQSTDVKFQTLTPDFADEPGIMETKAAYLTRVTAEDLLGKTPKSPTSNGDKYAGSEACLGCHAKAAEAWRASDHSHAIRSLEEVSEDKDPECVQCHVVGLDRVGGFENHTKTPKLENVGCESCHGPAAKHAANSSVKLPKAGPASCAVCHVPQHSPGFDFAKFWDKIKH